MKILLANKYFYLKGGAEVSFFETANLLRAMGHKVIYFSMKHTRNIPSRFEKYFVSNVSYETSKIKEKIDISLKLLYSLEAKRNIKRLIEDERPDIVHLNNIYHQISPSILHTIKNYDLPIIMTLRDYKMVCASYTLFHSGNKCEYCQNGKYYHCFFKGCVKNSKIKSLLSTLEMYLHHSILDIFDTVDIFTTTSRYIKNKLNVMGLNGKYEIYRIPNFLRIDEYSIKKVWDERSIVYFGRLSKEKGLFTLLDAVKNIKKVIVKIIGEGPIKKDLIKKIEIENIKNVKLLGYISGENLKKEIMKSQFVVFPSEWDEPFGRTALETFALGMPVIGARIGGIPELVRDNETGLLFQPGSADDLCYKINYLLDNKNKVIQMGANARHFVEKEFSAKKNYYKLIEIYQKAIEKHKI